MYWRCAESFESMFRSVYSFTEASNFCPSSYSRKVSEMYFSGCFLVNSCYFDFSVFFEKIYDVDFDLLDEDDELSALLFDYESCSFYGLSTYNFVSSRSFLFIESLIVYRFLITSNYYNSSGVMLTISLPLLPTLEFERFNGPRIVLLLPYIPACC